jgi:hypothetical protein
MADFRRNVDPSLRRKTDKNIIELNSLKAEYNNCKIDADKCRKNLEREKSALSQARSLSEQANDKLSDAQVEIDSDPLPEGAQPRPRIHKRDQISMVRIFSVAIPNNHANHHFNYRKWTSYTQL